jgi:hypothetical protein
MLEQTFVQRQEPMIGSIRVVAEMVGLYVFGINAMLILTHCGGPACPSILLNQA